MTTKPKGKKFRIRRTGPTAPAGEAGRAAATGGDEGAVDDGFGDVRYPTAGPQTPPGEGDRDAGAQAATGQDGAHNRNSPPADRRSRRNLPRSVPRA